jgi:hypothetical protein
MYQRQVVTIYRLGNLMQTQIFITLILKQEAVGAAVGESHFEQLDFIELHHVHIAMGY